MKIKAYLRKNGIKLGIIVLLLALIIGAGSVLRQGNAGVVKDVAGTVRTPVQQIVSSISEWLQSLYGRLYEYDALVAENERLRGELTEAQEEARNGYAALEENERLRNLLNFKEKHSDFELESAKVVSWTTSNWAHAFTISKGEGAGIEVGDAVITEYGVLVGQVTELGENWATVSTVIDINTNIGALVAQTGSAGLMVGDFALMQDGYAKLSYLAEGAQIFTGDEILTSGNGGIFPQGLMIGTIDTIQSEAGGQIEYGLVKPNCDLTSLVQVFVIKDFEVVE